MPHEFELHHTVDVDAAVEQVWEAIATGPGVDCWFMGRSEVEPQLGGAVRTAVGPFVQESVVTAWEPLKRFAYQGQRRPDGSLLALEWIIEARAGGGVSLRSVGSGFIGSDDWEGEYESLRAGGAFYLHNLVQYLTHFAGQPGTPIGAVCPTTDDLVQVRKRITVGLGLPDLVVVGDRVRLAAAGLSLINGVVDYATPQFLGVRSEGGLYRFYAGPGGMVTAEHHLFADRRPQVERAWQAWLTHLFG